MFRNALISCSDKSGLKELLSPLVKDGLQIVSTGGTAKHLRECGFKVKDVSEVTQFPEVMGGRVKTLHPKVHMSLLARMGEQEDVDLLKKFDIQLFDLIVVNLYPFEKTIQNTSDFSEWIENIDIGGPAMLRAAAKNFESIAVLSNPAQYSWFLENRNNLGQDERLALAAEVFSQISVYDSMVGQTLSSKIKNQKNRTTSFPFGGYEHKQLRYGENPHQKSTWYRMPGVSSGLHSAQFIQGKELSYNNIQDLEAAASLARRFAEPCAVAVKHNNPCGVGTGSTDFEAVEKTLKADPVSVFGGIVALNTRLTLKSAQALSQIFLECIIAPDISDDAQEHLNQKKNLRVLIWDKMNVASQGFEIKSVNGGFLFQNTDDQFSEKNNWKIYGEKLSTQIEKDMIFGEKVCSALKSNAIAIVKNGQTLGLGMGQVNRIDAVEQAIQRAEKHHRGNLNEAVLISDAFFPFPDSIELCSKHNIKWVFQPGGSVKDEDVILAAKSKNINMVMTGIRHFKH